MVFNDSWKFSKMTTKRKRTVCLLKIKVTKCEHLDKGSSKREVTSEYNIGKSLVSELFL